MSLTNREILAGKVEESRADPTLFEEILRAGGLGRGLATQTHL
jgi:hypothetical protein